MSKPGPLVNDLIHSLAFCYMELKLDGKSHKVLSENLSKVIIKSNMDNSYPVLQLYFFSDNQLFIEENIYPQRKITLEVHYNDENGEEQPDPVVFDLVILEHDLQLPPKRYNNVSDHKENQRRMSCATCICVTAFKAMTSIVNRLWEGDGEKDNIISPYDAAIQLIQDAGISDIDAIADGKNDHKLDQLLIPPMSLGEALNYLNNMYGLYDNECLKYIDYNGTFRMYDIVKYYNSHMKGDIHLHKLPSFAPKEITDPPTKKAKQYFDHFVNYDNASTLIRSNDAFVKNGFKQTYVYHPFFDIAYFVNKDLSKQTKDHGLVPGSNTNLKIRKDVLSERYNVHYEDIGMMKTYYGSDASERFFNRRISREMMALNYVKFNVNRKIKIHYLIKPGQIVYFKPYSEHEYFQGSNYEGAYMIISSTVTLTRSREGMMGDSAVCDAEVVGVRTIQSMD